MRQGVEFALGPAPQLTKNHPHRILAPPFEVNFLKGGTPRTTTRDESAFRGTPNSDSPLFFTDESDLSKRVGDYSPSTLGNERQLRMNAMGIIPPRRIVAS